MSVAMAAMSVVATVVMVAMVGFIIFVNDDRRRAIVHWAFLHDHVGLLNHHRLRLGGWGGQLGSQRSLLHHADQRIADTGSMKCDDVADFDAPLDPIGL